MRRDINISGSVWGGGPGPCGGKGYVGLRYQGSTSTFGNLWLLATLLPAFAFGGLESLTFHLVFGFRQSRYTLSDGKRNSILSTATQWSCPYTGKDFTSVRNRNECRISSFLRNLSPPPPLIWGKTHSKHVSTRIISFLQ